ncbi:hypothetical protein [Shewanella sp. MBTL60-007]|uniref:hypothetical protein n=1 Tax=Shewanella sp. MBTL60-007 TaxID=2815911 RepID=UPI001BB95FF5|nr:hypothetical protein [Shewanella sp. MBTL60-007]GIU18388.1 hypothetical protein TUM3792_14480 [Shewanella sp. MBTL60-007]
MLVSNPPISNHSQQHVGNTAQSNDQVQVSSSSQLNKQRDPHSTNAAVVQIDTVTLSAKSIALSKQAPDSKSPQTLPAQPKLPNEGEKVEAYVEYKKAKVQYQIYADIAGVATGNGNGLSPATAYYLSNNDDARAATVNAKAQQQQLASMQTYVETSQNSNKMY